jgi:hypothetical protein
MATIMHKQEQPRREQRNENTGSGCEPAGDAAAPGSRPPQQYQRSQSGENLHQTFSVVGIGISKPNSLFFFFKHVD